MPDEMMAMLDGQVSRALRATNAARESVGLAPVAPEDLDG